MPRKTYSSGTQDLLILSIKKARKAFVAEDDESCGRRWCSDDSVIDRIASAYDEIELLIEDCRMDACLDALHDAAQTDNYYDEKYRLEGYKNERRYFGQEEDERSYGSPD